MDRSARHEINNKLQIILAHSSKLPKDKAHAVEAAVWDIKSLVNETPDEKMLREFDELLEAKRAMREEDERACESLTVDLLSGMGRKVGFK